MPVNPREIIKENRHIMNLMMQDDCLMLQLESCIHRCVETFQKGGQVLFCGNGGSAADAQHLAAELSCRFYEDRAPLNAEALHVNTSYLTAAANDYNYEMVFARLVEAKGRKGDVLIGLTTSGASKNVLKAFEKANEMGMDTLSFTGQSGGEIKGMSSVCLQVPSRDTARIQEAHILLGHILCAAIEERLFQ